jgi:hypothetical protein
MELMWALETNAVVQKAIEIESQFGDALATNLKLNGFTTRATSSWTKKQLVTQRNLYIEKRR